MTTRAIRTILAVVLLAALALTSAHAQGTCNGRFPNPITDICWSCIFPIKLGSKTLMGRDQEDNDTSNSYSCSCSTATSVTLGLNLSFFEPARIAEVVRQPYCFPMLGGAKLDMGTRAPAHGRNPGSAAKGQTGSFYQAHWYINPMLFYLEAIMDNNCLEQNVFDMAYVTELDPLWNDTDATFVLNPDATLFTDMAAKIACGYDCVQASIGMPTDNIWWCAGCQGHMYPLTGFVSAHVSGIQASTLIMQRLTNKLHREGLMWAASGKEGRCGFYIEPIMKKSNYKYQMVYPRRQTSKVDGKCCQPFGRTTQLWQAGKQFPFGGEDFAYQIFRKRDCCSAVGAVGF